MKKKQIVPLLICLLSFFLISLAPIMAQDKTFKKSEEPPVLSTDKQVIDFGELLEGERVSQKLKISNKGKGDLTLLKIDFTCGCTIPQIVMPSGEIVIPDRKKENKIGVLLPGETAELELEFKALGYKGKLNRRLSIFSNDPQFRETQILVEAVVRPAFTMEPKKFDFGIVPRGKEIKQTMMIRSPKLEAFSVIGLKDLPPFLTYSIEPFTEEEKTCARLTLTLEKDAPIGSKNLKFLADVESDKVKEIILYAYLDVRPPITFRQVGAEPFMAERNRPESEIDLGVLKPGTGSTQEFEIINENHEIPYKILGMEFTSRHADFIETKLITIDEGNHYKIRVDVKPEIDARFFRGTLTLTSDHPDLKQKEIFVKGWVSKD
ncbi:MAG: DUF1573 domain-containing protein [Planctomycetota bacterium]